MHSRPRPLRNTKKLKKTQKTHFVVCVVVLQNSSGPVIRIAKTRVACAVELRDFFRCFCANCWPILVPFWMLTNVFFCATFIFWMRAAPTLRGVASCGVAAARVLCLFLCPMWVYLRQFQCYQFGKRWSYIFSEFVLTPDQE